MVRLNVAWVALLLTWTNVAQAQGGPGSVYVPPEEQPAQPGPGQPGYVAPKTPPPPPATPYYPQPAYQPPAYQQPAYQQPAPAPQPGYQQPGYQQPAYPPPAAQPAPAPAPAPAPTPAPPPPYREQSDFSDTQPRPSTSAPPPAVAPATGAAPAVGPDGKEPSYTDQLQKKLVAWGMRALLTSVPSGIALVLGGLVGAVAAGALSGIFIGAGISQEILRPNPILALFVIPIVALGALIVGGLAYMAVRAVSVGLVSMFYAGGGARDINDRLRNLRVMSVSDIFGHIGATVLSLSVVGFFGVVGMLTSSLVGLGALTYALQENAPESTGFQIPPRFTRYTVLTIPALMTLGILSTGVVGLALIGTVVLAHLGLPLSASVVAPLIFGDADPAPTVQ